MSEAQDLDTKALPPTELTIGEQKRIRVIQGVPTQIDQKGQWNPPGTKMIVIPNAPHVFKVDELIVRDKDHPNEHLTNITVLMAHGIRVDNKWKFLGGEDVVDTVEAYESYAQTHGLKPIEFLIVCNQSEPEPFGVRIGDLDATHSIAYAVGEDVHIALGGKSKVYSGKTVMEVSVEKHFFGLDLLKSHKYLQSRIKILP